MHRALYLIAAEIIVVLHLGWLLLALVGAFWMFWHPGYAWVQLAVAGITCVHNLTARVCVATRFEKWLRMKSVGLAQTHHNIRSRYTAIVAPALMPLGRDLAKYAIPLLTAISTVLSLWVLAKHGRLW